jgi:pyruvate carboxylase
LKSSTAEIYKYEIPGGQYSNLKPQVESFGLGHRFTEVKEMFKRVNDMLGDIVKVTPSSKTVGDLAIFMVQNDLTPENILEKGKGLSFPDSAVAYFQGMMGQPEGGFPAELQKIVLKGEKPITVRPGELLEPEDFEQIKNDLAKKHNIEPTMQDILSSALYPKVFDDYLTYLREYGDFSRMGSDIFFHGIKEGETCEIEIADGKILVIKLREIGKMDEDGYVSLHFEVNDSVRVVKIKDKKKAAAKEQAVTRMADLTNPLEIGASIPGKVIKILAKPGDKVRVNQEIAVIEAMKMETSVVSLVEGTVESIAVKEGQIVKSGELLITLA